MYDVLFWLTSQKDQHRSTTSRLLAKQSRRRLDGMSDTRIRIVTSAARETAKVGTGKMSRQETAFCTVVGIKG